MLKKLKFIINAYDPVVDHEEVINEYNFSPIKQISNKDRFDLIILAVKHDVFKKFENKILEKLKPGGFVFDIKSFFKKTSYIESL